MSLLVDHLLGVAPAVAYVVIGTLMFAEAALFAGLVLPGETAVIIGGVLAAAHRLSLPALLCWSWSPPLSGTPSGTRSANVPGLGCWRRGRYAGMPVDSMERGSSCKDGSAAACCRPVPPRSCEQSCQSWPD